MLTEDETLALCADADPLITLLNYLLVTRRDDRGKLRLLPVAKMHPAAQQLFFSHFDPQRLADIAGDASRTREVRRAAAAVLDCCAEGGWRLRSESASAELGAITGLIVQEQCRQRRTDRAAESICAFTGIDRHAGDALARLMAA